MGKISMNKIDKDMLLSMLVSGRVDLKIPKAVEVVDFQNGEFDRGEKGIMYWANLTVVDAEEIELLRSIGLEDNATLIKMKITGYENEDLSPLIKEVLDTSETELIFVEKKNKLGGSEIVGLAFKEDLTRLVLKGAK